MVYCTWYIKKAPPCTYEPGLESVKAGYRGVRRLLLQGLVWFHMRRCGSCHVEHVDMISFS